MDLEQPIGLGPWFSLRSFAPQGTSDTTDKEGGWGDAGEVLYPTDRDQECC